MPMQIQESKLPSYSRAKEKSRRRPRVLLETLRNRTAQGEDGKISLCDVRDCLLRKLFDAISGLSLPSS